MSLLPAEEARRRLHEAVSAVCGDRILLELRLQGDRVAEAAFRGDGCALAIASARADAGVRAAELVAHAVEGARNVPQTPSP